MKWNSTWRYTRRLRTRESTTARSTTLKIKSTSTIITSSMPKTKQHVSSSAHITRTNDISLPISMNTKSLSMLTLKRKYSTVPMITSTVPVSRLSVSHEYLQTTFHDKTNRILQTTTTIPLTMSSVSSSFMSTKRNLPSPTPWYPPVGPLDWWQWKWYTKKFKKVSLEIVATTEPTTLFSTSTRTQTRPTMQDERTMDWFQWPQTEPVLTTKDRLDYIEENDSDDFKSIRTSTLQSMPLVTSISLLSDKHPTYPERKLFFPKFNEQFTPRTLTMHKPIMEHYYAEQNRLTIRYNGRRKQQQQINVSINSIRIDDTSIVSLIFFVVFTVYYI
jgi:hypothetical protein